MNKTQALRQLLLRRRLEAIEGMINSGKYPKEYDFWMTRRKEVLIQLNLVQNEEWNHD